MLQMVFVHLWTYNEIWRHAAGNICRALFEKYMQEHRTKLKWNDWRSEVKK